MNHLAFILIILFATLSGSVVCPDPTVDPRTSSIPIVPKVLALEKDTTESRPTTDAFLSHSSWQLLASALYYGMLVSLTLHLSWLPAVFDANNPMVKPITFHSALPITATLLVASILNDHVFNTNEDWQDDPLIHSLQVNHEPQSLVYFFRLLHRTCHFILACNLPASVINGVRWLSFKVHQMPLWSFLPQEESEIEKLASLVKCETMTGDEYCKLTTHNLPIFHLTQLPYWISLLFIAILSSLKPTLYAKILTPLVPLTLGSLIWTCPSSLVDFFFNFPLIMICVAILALSARPVMTLARHARGTR